MGNANHTSQIKRTLDKTKEKLTENAVLESKTKKRKFKKNDRQDKFSLVQNGCKGCRHSGCRYYIKGQEELKQIGRDKYGCHK